MKNKLKNLPIRIKMTGISLAVNMLVFMINIVLLIAMNNMSDKIDTVYQANLQLNEIQARLQYPILHNNQSLFPALYTIH